ncbi:MAG TPA: NADH-quinone oxidoreductase subunit M [Aggregatilineales bacterium]|nr:NADH-quinone oxidoreductase subunit M [Anaerolineales bacterium]HRE47148.1 NADH-quinone oxidoreductase subunit M [Aggregatilineales bacterium]
MNLDLLSLITFLPMLGAGVVIVLPRSQKNLARLVALGFSLAVLGLAIFLFYSYAGGNCPPGNVPTEMAAASAGSPYGFACQNVAPFFDLLGSHWHVGVDGLSVAMILLAAILTPLAILISYEVTDRVHEIMALFLFMEMGVLGVFVSLDLLIFFIFWEVGLVPMYFLINYWGGAKRQYASFKFFLYTMAGSLGLLLAIQVITVITGTMDIPTLLANFPKDLTATGAAISLPFSGNLNVVKGFLFIAFFLAFAVKVPVYPFHTWLPDAHTEAPTGGSMLLAGILLKLGAYGFLRLVVPLFPAQSASFAPVIATLAVLGIILGALAAWGQNDFKRLVAYSSVNHMGFVVLGIAAFAAVYNNLYTGAVIENREIVVRSVTMATNGAVLQMFTHGLSSAGMFLLVGALYHKAHTRQLTDFGGLWNIAPMYGGLLVFVSMGSLGLPGLAGFVSEYQVIAGAWWIYPAFVFIAMFGLLMTGAYILKGIRAVLAGPVNEHWRGHHLEIEFREMVALAPLMVLMLVTGIYPNWIMPVINQTVTRLFGG